METVYHSNSESPMYSDSAHYDFAIKWLDYLYDNHIIEKWKYDEAAELLAEDVDPGLMAVASRAMIHTKKTGQLMPAWITDTYTEAFHADSWLICDDYLEYMQSQEEAKKALAAEQL